MTIVDVTMIDIAAFIIPVIPFIGVVEPHADRDQVLGRGIQSQCRHHGLMQRYITESFLGHHHA